jgi:hypothetical protein
MVVTIPVTEVSSFSKHTGQVGNSRSAGDNGPDDVAAAAVAAAEAAPGAEAGASATPYVAPPPPLLPLLPLSGMVYRSTTALEPSAAVTSVAAAFIGETPRARYGSPSGSKAGDVALRPLDGSAGAWAPKAGEGEDEGVVLIGAGAGAGTDGEAKLASNS